MELEKNHPELANTDQKDKHDIIHLKVNISYFFKDNHATIIHRPREAKYQGASPLEGEIE